MILYIALSILALAGIAGTIRAVVTDGYHRVPTRQSHVAARGLENQMRSS